MKQLAYILIACLLLCGCKQRPTNTTPAASIPEVVEETPEDMVKRLAVDVAAESISTYRMLRMQWQSLGNDTYKKNEFLFNHKYEIRSLGFLANTIADAENLFSKQEAIENALTFRAEAKVAEALAKEHTKEAYKLERELEELEKELEELQKAKASMK